MLFGVQVLQWIQQPTDINSLRDFAEWKEKCDVKVRDKGKIRISKTTEYKDDFHTLLCFLGPASLLPAQPLPFEHTRIARRDFKVSNVKYYQIPFSSITKSQRKAYFMRNFLTL